LPKTKIKTELKPRKMPQERCRKCYNLKLAFAHAIGEAKDKAQRTLQDHRSTHISVVGGLTFWRDHTTGSWGGVPKGDDS